MNSSHCSRRKPKLPARTIPLIGLAQAGSGGYFDDGGFPVGTGWDDVLFPDMNEENVYALEVSGNSMEPLYRKGDILIVSPLKRVRDGDRVVVKTRDGEVLAKELKKKTQKFIELRSVNPEHKDRTIKLSDRRLDRADCLGEPVITPSARARRRSSRPYCRRHRPRRTNRSAGLSPGRATPDRAC